MHSYTISISFRGSDLAATVHQYETLCLVYFTDNLILQEFGGVIEFDAKGNPNAVAGQEGKDFPDLCRSVKMQLH
jgi:hypothetical protein